MRALEILRDEGAVSLARASKTFAREKLQRSWPGRRVAPVVRDLVYRYRYGRAAPTPGRLIRIDPGEVDYLLAPHFWDRLSRCSTHVRGGDWDRSYTDREVVLSGRHEGITTPSLVPFENFELYTSARAHFEEGVPWEDTDLYESLLENRDAYWRTYGSREDVRRALADVDRLYRSIDEDGYRLQREVETDRIRFTSWSLPPEYHEVAVDVGRDGDLIFDDGRHRFVVAKVLGLDAVPVRVFVRHREWQQLRYEVSTATSPADLSDRARRHLDHPDMADVVRDELSVTAPGRPRPVGGNAS